LFVYRYDSWIRRARICISIRRRGQRSKAWAFVTILSFSRIDVVAVAV
jgi:hypothetical protein